jgi:hypothetical protein
MRRPKQGQAAKSGLPEQEWGLEKRESRRVGQSLTLRMRGLTKVKIPDDPAPR